MARTKNPLKAYELTQDMKDEFIDLIRQGERRDTAAHTIGSTGSQFRKLSSPDSPHYDPVFTKRYKQALDSDEHRTNFLDQLRDAAQKKALVDGDVSLKREGFVSARETAGSPSADNSQSPQTPQ